MSKFKANPKFEQAFSRFIKDIVPDTDEVERLATEGIRQWLAKNGKQTLMQHLTNMIEESVEDGNDEGWDEWQELFAKRAAKSIALTITNNVCSLANYEE